MGSLRWPIDVEKEKEKIRIEVACEESHCCLLNRKLFWLFLQLFSPSCGRSDGLLGLANSGTFLNKRGRGIFSKMCLRLSCSLVLPPPLLLLDGDDDHLPLSVIYTQQKGSKHKINFNECKNNMESQP